MTTPAPSPRDPLRPTEAELNVFSTGYLATREYEPAFRAVNALALPRLIRAVVDAIPYTAFERDNVSRALLFDDRPDLLNELLAAAARLTEER